MIILQVLELFLKLLSFFEKIGHWRVPKVLRAVLKEAERDRVILLIVSLFLKYFLDLLVGESIVGRRLLFELSLQLRIVVSFLFGGELIHPQITFVCLGL